MVKEKFDTTTIIKGNEQVVDREPKSQQEEHERQSRVKHGVQRLDKQSGQGTSGQPKKGGHGGKFTWGGPDDETSAEDAPVALDKNDPNYVDEEEEEADRKAAAGVVEVSKSENSASTHEKV